MTHHVIASLYQLHNAMKEKNDNVVNDTLDRELIVSEALKYDVYALLDTEITHVTLRDYLNYDHVDFETDAYDCDMIISLIKECEYIESH